MGATKEKRIRGNNIELPVESSLPAFYPVHSCNPLHVFIIPYIHLPGPSSHSAIVFTLLKPFQQGRKDNHSLFNSGKLWGLSLVFSAGDY